MAFGRSVIMNSYRLHSIIYRAGTYNLNYILAQLHVGKKLIPIKYSNVYCIFSIFLSSIPYLCNRT